MTPSGSWVIASSSFCPGSREHDLAPQRPADSARKKSIRVRSPFNSLRDCRIGLPTSCVSVRASVSCSATIRSRKRAMAASRRAMPRAAHAGCAARARSTLRRTEAAVSVATSAISAPSAGLRIFIGVPGSGSEGKGGRLVLRGGRQEVVEDRRVVDERAVGRVVELGVPLDAEHVRRAGPADRLDDAVRLRPGLDDEVAAEVLDRLVVDRVGLGDGSAAGRAARGRCRGRSTSRGSCPRRSPSCGG